MKPRKTWDRWRRPLVALGFGAAIFGLSVGRGHGLELLWLPAVLLAATWPHEQKSTARVCFDRLRSRQGNRG